MSDARGYSRSRAVLIGSTFYNDPAYPPLPAVTNSLEGMASALIDPTIGGWPRDRVTLVKDPSDVRKIVRSLRRWAAETEDVLLLYFVGHGTIVNSGQLCLVLSDTDAEDPDVTGLEYERVRRALLDSPARTKIVILDCCYSGRAIEALSGGNEVADSVDTTGVYTLTASDHTAHVVELARQSDSYTSFTGELLSILRAGVSNGPDRLTLNLIYQLLRQNLKKRGLPAPNQRGTDTVDQYKFVKNSALRRGREMRVVGVRVEQPANQPILLLRELYGERYLPIWTGSVEASRITRAQQGLPTIDHHGIDLSNRNAGTGKIPQVGTDAIGPGTVELFGSIFDALGVAMDFSRIDALTEGTFFASITVDGVSVSARPSDAALLSILNRVPLYATEEVLEAAGLIIPE